MYEPTERAQCYTGVRHTCIQALRPGSAALPIHIEQGRRLSQGAPPTGVYRRSCDHVATFSGAVLTSAGVYGAVLLLPRVSAMPENLPGVRAGRKLRHVI